MTNPKEIIIYTDGACSGNPGPGGYAAVLTCGSLRKELSAGYRLTTNNRMELLAVISALSALKKPEDYKVTIYCDSNLIVSAVNKHWIDNWKKRGWHKADKEKVINPELWNELDKLISKCNPTFIHINSHIGITENERCDKLAKAAAGGSNLLIDYTYEQSKQE